MKTLMTDYGMILVLLIFCLFFSVMTLEQQSPAGAAAGKRIAGAILRQYGPDTPVLIATGATEDGRKMIGAIEAELQAGQFETVAVAVGDPRAARQVLDGWNDQATQQVLVVTDAPASEWGVFREPDERFANIGSVDQITPEPYWWSNFLTVENLLNIADRIVVIAVIAIGMTMVIITAGIDLSVGSLVALSAVTGASFIVRVGGAEQASVMAMALGGLIAILLCAGVGFFSGMTVALLDIPPFIVTLAMMLVASGFAYILSGGQSIYQLPDGFGWLGAGTTFNVPNAVILMLLLYLIAHVVMSHTTLGRYIYATGGNEEAARLSGVPTRKIKVFVYVVAGALAGLGGMIEASQLASGRPNSGLMYELYVIAAVVVGGTSLTGGEGKIFGTLIGAFIIAVIQNGMNLMLVESYTQKVVFGCVILAAVVVDTIKKRGWFRFSSGGQRQQ